MRSERTLNYFVRGSIIARLVSSLVDQTFVICGGKPTESKPVKLKAIHTYRVTSPSFECSLNMLKR